MIYTRLTNQAMRIAYEAHRDQTDKAGIPYIFHPIHLAEQMDDECSVCVALLHDVVEDTPVTLEQLAETFPKEVIDAIALMTHDRGEPYYDYVARIRTNPIAKKVKLADLRHNTDASRMPDASKETLAYYQNKYARAFKILEEE